MQHTSVQLQAHCQMISLSSYDSPLVSKPVCLTISLTLLPDMIIPVQAQSEMIDVQRQVLEKAAWKEEELKAQLASLDLLYGEEVETRQSLTKQLAQLKEQSGMDQVCTQRSLKVTLPLLLYTLTVLCTCLCFHQLLT